MDAFAWAERAILNFRAGREEGTGKGWRLKFDANEFFHASPLLTFFFENCFDISDHTTTLSQRCTVPHWFRASQYGNRLPHKEIPPHKTKWLGSWRRNLYFSTLCLPPFLRMSPVKKLISTFHRNFQFWDLSKISQTRVDKFKHPAHLLNVFNSNAWINKVHATPEIKL